MQHERFAAPTFQVLLKHSKYTNNVLKCLKNVIRPKTKCKIQD